MPLTPEDVSTKRFRMTRMRGYDMAEVDAFLDEVEVELSRLLSENAALRPSAAAGAEAPAGPSGTPTLEKPPSPDAATAEPPAKVTTTAEASAAATRLLELAGRNADQLVEEARAEAERIVGEARSAAEALNQETATQREQRFGDIEQQKAAMEAEISRLRAFEREYRAELRTYFEEHLAALDGQESAGLLGRLSAQSADDEPPRLQSLLQEDAAPE